jgi:hypothetical protein
MIDDEFEVCFELLLSVVRDHLPVPYPGCAKKTGAGTGTVQVPVAYLSYLKVL